jgi:hypothetical protein
MTQHAVVSNSASKDAGTRGAVTVGGNKPPRTILTDVTATVTTHEPSRQIAPVDASTATKIFKFLENVVVWPDPGDTGYINMHVTVPNALGSMGIIGWPFKDRYTFMRRAAWTNSVSNFLSVRACMSQQSDCTKTQRGKPKAVTEVRNATCLRSIWINCEVKPKGRKNYRTLREARVAIDAFRRKVGLPFPSAVVDSGNALQVYWISDTPLSRDEWKPFAYGLGFLLRREVVKCDGSTFQCTQMLPVPGTMRHLSCTPPRPVEVVHIGQRYDFSNALSFLRNTAIETWTANRAHFAIAKLVDKPNLHLNETTQGAS